MADFPLPLTALFGHWGAYVVYALVGFGFGFVLESAGFGNSRKLAAQFYFKELTVLKVMFTAIIVAMVLVFVTSGMGLLDYNLLWVPPTYLWPGIVGGFIMGIGFIVGGFCPGTSLVAAATLKIDGIFFVGGVLFGIFVFGESVASFDGFFNSAYMGRFTLPELLHVSYGVVVLGVVLMALFMFWGGELLEQHFGGIRRSDAPSWRYGAAGGVLALGLLALLIGQPTNADRWQAMAEEKQPLLDERQIYASGWEVASLIQDPKIKLMLLDVRSEAEYNLFHLQDARHVSLTRLLDHSDAFIAEPGNTVFMLHSNNEQRATEAWKRLQAASVPNVYVLEGGLNRWLQQFAEPALAFDAALGANHPAAVAPKLPVGLSFESKVKLELKRAPSGGGCG